MSISVTIRDIWTKFDIHIKHHTINMTKCAKFTWLENSVWRRLPTWISEYVNDTELDRAICTKFGGQMRNATWRWHMTKTRNRKFICVTSLNKCREHRCDDVKAYKRSQLTDLYFKLLSICRTHLFALLSRLLIRLLPTNFIKTANIRGYLKGGGGEPARHP